MRGLFRQGLGNKRVTPRRVDIGRGRLVQPVGTKSRPLIVERQEPVYTKKAVQLLIATGLVLCVLIALTGCAGQQSAAHAQNSIEIDSLRLTAAGHFLDLRYHVLDAERANESLGPGVKPVLIDEASGAVMAVPTSAKLGSLRQTRGVQKPDRSYFVLFVNTAGLSSGSHVTARIGDMTFENLVIE